MFQFSPRNVRRTAVLSANASEEQSQCICSPSDDAMVDSLLEGLLYEDQSGSFFEAFLRKAANQVLFQTLLRNADVGVFEFLNPNPTLKPNPNPNPTLTKPYSKYFHEKFMTDPELA